MRLALRFSRSLALAGACALGIGAARADVDFTEPVLFHAALADDARSTLARGPDGALYGTARAGGADGKGTIFRFVPGSDVAVDVHDFDAVHGSQPRAGLTLLPDGSFWGTASYGGSHGRGVVFRFVPGSGAFEVIHEFDGVDGDGPCAAPTLGADGRLYGTTTGREPGFAGSVWVIDPATRAYTTIRVFEGLASGNKLGHGPSGQLVQAVDGQLYGTAYEGGEHGLGTIFRVDPATLRVQVVHAFDGRGGAKPFAGLVAGPAGALFGTTTQGGRYDGGTVFRFGRHGAFEVLHDFQAFADAYSPVAPLMLASDRYLYGTSLDLGDGSLYRLRVDGSGYERFYELGWVGSAYASDGIYPYGALLEVDGALWGLTTASVRRFGTGSIYRVSLPVTRH